MQLARTILAASVVLVTLALSGTANAQPPAAKPLTTLDLFRQAREFINIGKYDLAAEKLKDLLAAKPTDEQYLEIQKVFGDAVFAKLRNVLRWHDDKTVEDDARKTVNELIAGSDLAVRNAIRDPKKIAYFVDRLGGTREERLYAEIQLKPTGDAAIPVMIDRLRNSPRMELKSAIIAFLPSLSVTTVAPILASLDAIPDAFKPLVIASIAKREDVLSLIRESETNFLPYLWRYAGSKDATDLKTVSASMLRSLTNSHSDRQKPETELTRLALPFVDGKATFTATGDTDLKIWTWDGVANAPVQETMTRKAAEEYLGLRYLQWALEINANYQPAQEYFIQLATERAVERAKYSYIARVEPFAYHLLMTAPAELLATELEKALAEKKTAIALGILQVLGDRFHKDTTLPAGRLGPFVKALDYPDFRVQFATAIAILKSPRGSQSQTHVKIVEILKRGLASEPEGGSQTGNFKVIIADVDVVRGERLAVLFRDLGYHPEVVRSGRELMRRISQSRQYDMIAIDRHIVDPLIHDLITQLGASPTTAKIPTMILASTDKVPEVPFEHLLLRFAQMVAAADVVLEPSDPYFVPGAYVNDPLRPVENVDNAKKKAIESRDNALRNRAELRSKRMRRLVDAADIPLSEIDRKRIEERIDQFTLSILIPEFDVTAASAPETWTRWIEQNRIARNTVRRLGNMNEPKLTAKFREMLDPFETSMTKDQKARMERFQRLVTSDSQGLAYEVPRDLDLEKALTKSIKSFPGARVYPEPYAGIVLNDIITHLLADPAAMPRSPEEKKLTARVSALWLRRMALNEVKGYDVKSAESLILSAIKSDDLAADCLEATIHFGNADAQQAAINTALAAMRPLPIRLLAADASLKHLQTFGKLVPDTFAPQVKEAAVGEADATLKGKLNAISLLLTPDLSTFNGSIQSFPVKPVTPKAPVPVPVPAPEPKNP